MPPELGELRHLGRVGIIGRRRRHGCIALGLDCRDLLEDELEPLELALDLPPQPWREFPTIPGPKLVQALPPVAPQRLDVIDALGCEQTLDPVHVLHALGDQPLALAVGAPRVLPLDRGHLHHAAGRPVAAPPRHQSPQQHRRVQPIGLGPPRPAIHLQAAGVHHPAGDPLGRKAALQPEPVIAGLIAEDDLHVITARPLLPCLQATQQCEQAGDVAALQPVRRGFAAR